MASRRAEGQVPFGWVEISEAGLQRLRRELEAKSEGVVDEMGLLAIHTGYADRFFPGTSVQHTRPRYLFFVCWNLLWLAKQRGDVLKRKDAADLWVTRQLVTNEHLVDKNGIIGIQVYGDDPSRLPALRVDFIYWTALRRWDFYRSEHAQTRARLFRRWRTGSIVRVGDGDDARDESVRDEPLAELHVPPLPEWWQADEATGIDFALTGPEARWLQERLRALEEPAGGPCLLAKAAELCSEQEPRVTDGSGRDHPWDDPLALEAARASGQQDRLERARRASALAYYVRAIYAALVEWIVVADRGREDRHFRDGLDELAADAELRDAALGLSLAALFEDVPRIPQPLRRVLHHVQEVLLRAGAGDRASDVFLTDGTYQLFVTVEYRRKGSRARLPRTDSGAARRLDIDSINVYDLDYRWRPVRTLLSDLHRGLIR